MKSSIRLRQNKNIKSKPPETQKCPLTPMIIYFIIRSFYRRRQRSLCTMQEWLHNVARLLSCFYWITKYSSTLHRRLVREAEVKISDRIHRHDSLFLRFNNSSFLSCQSGSMRRPRAQVSGLRLKHLQLRAQGQLCLKKPFH